MLDDYAGGLVELFYTFQRRISIGNIVVRKLFALQLLGGCNTGFRRALLAIES